MRLGGRGGAGVGSVARASGGAGGAHAAWLQSLLLGLKKAPPPLVLDSAPRGPETTPKRFFFPLLKIRFIFLLRKTWGTEMRKTDPDNLSLGHPQPAEFRVCPDPTLTLHESSAEPSVCPGGPGCRGCQLLGEPCHLGFGWFEPGPYGSLRSPRPIL